VTEAVVTGRVVDAEGQGVEGASVLLRTNVGSFMRRDTDPCEGRPGPEYRLRTADAGHFAKRLGSIRFENDVCVRVTVDPPAGFALEVAEVPPQVVELRFEHPDVPPDSAHFEIVLIRGG
jgi:hypothetical protein